MITIDEKKLAELMSNGWSYRKYYGGDGSGGSGDDETNTYILVDEAGNEVQAVLVSEETVFDATPNDIREGKTAVTDAGVTVGTKDIPAYHTFEGFKVISAGKPFSFSLRDWTNYTKLQVIICAVNTTSSNSVAAEKVAINDKVYAVGSTEELSTVTMTEDGTSINLGIINEGERPCIMRYFTYKEEY